MAEAGQQRAVTAAFPPPPPFWKHFTTQNLEKLEELKREAENREGRKAWTPAALRELELPQELRYLVPPEAPSSGTYSLFGEPQSVSINLPSLEEQGIEQLYPSPPAGSETALPPNHRFYLLKISKSLLLNFLEFVGLLSICPERFEEKLENIRNLFINAHHLLNLYRPHQARESLILMMEEQLENAKEEIKEMDRIKEKIGTFLEQLEAEGREKEVGTLGRKAAEDADKFRKQETRVEEARALWKLANDVDTP